MVLARLHRVPTAPTGRHEAGRTGVRTFAPTKSIAQPRPWPERAGVALALLVLAAALTSAEHALSGEWTVAFYLAAVALATWFGGLACGAIVVVGGSLLELHNPAAAPTSWQLHSRAAWARFAAFAVVAAAFVILLDGVRRSARALARVVEQQRTVLRLLPVGVAIVQGEDAAPASMHINPALAEMLGTETDTCDLEHQHISGIDFQQEGQPVPDAMLPIHTAIATRALSPPQHLQVTRTGRFPVHVLAQAAPLVDEGGVRGAVAVYVDETEPRDREERLRHAIHAKDEFLAMISHELKTPLTIIAGNAEILARRFSSGDEMIRFALRDMRAASARLLVNVENLLMLARVGDRTLDLAPFPVRPTVAHVITSPIRSGDHIELECPGDAIAVGDPDLVEQVLENLLANAAKYGPPGAPIEIRVEPREDEVQVRVRDHGTGIPDDQLEAVFAPFYRSPDTSDMATGMGVGLAVCRQLVKAMGGQMWAAEADGGGAELVFTLARA